MKPENSVTWRIQKIDAKENMVFLVSDQSPTIKRFGLPEPVLDAFVDSEFVQVQCVSGITWHIRIADGSRRKIDKPLPQADNWSSD
jgi:hypothetical protein